jgi:hypothetical protein
MANVSDLFRVLDGYITSKHPHLATPFDVLVVTAVISGGVRCRRPADTNDNGYLYPTLDSYTTPTVGDVVLVSRLPSGPVVQQRLSS